MGHFVEFKGVARKSIEALPKDIKTRVISTAMSLGDNPRPPGCKKLKNRDAYRIKVGEYRVIYEIHDDALIVLVVRCIFRFDRAAAPVKRSRFAGATLQMKGVRVSSRS